jgi:hypothetical protein
MGLLVACVATVAACVPPRPPAPQPPKPATSPRPPDDHTVTLGADVLVTTYRLGRDEALRRMRTQPATIAAALDLQARLGLPDGAVRIDHAGGGKVVARTTSPTAASTAAEVGAAHSVEVVIEPAQRSPAENAALAGQLAAALVADGVEGFAVHYDPATDGFAIEVPPPPAAPAEPAPEDIAEEVASDAGLAPDDVAVDEVAGIQTAACTRDGRHCDTPLRGGPVMRAFVSTTRVLYCSAGFVGRATADGRYSVLTAGHCGSGAGAGKVWQSYRPAAAGWSDLGTPTGAAFGSAGDSAAITVQDAGGWAPAPTLVAGPAAVNPGASLHEGYRIEAAQHPVVGAVLCASGSSSGTSCAEVTGAGVTVSYQGSGGVTTLVEGLVRMDLRGRGLMCAGDSGGPVYANGLGFGLISGGALDSQRTIDNGVYRATVPCGRAAVYVQDLPDAAGRLGVVVGAREWRSRFGWSG